ncbi:MAG: HAMP domain-containing histidine kinase [Bacteroidaceae bacterium]|nr:HAMP domain-containing histidine kinase [Bacteroidaceae bacterium]
MRRSVIISLAIAMGISFLCLLGLQVSYISEILDMRRIHFQEDVKRSLTQVAHQLEVDEASRYLEQGPEAMTGIATAIDSITVSNDSSVIQRTHQVRAKDGSVFTSLETTAKTSMSDKFFTKRNHGAHNDRMRTLQEIMARRYSYEKTLVDEVIYSILYTAHDRPLGERIDFKQLDQYLKTELSINGIQLKYHYTVMDIDKTIVYRCADYEEEGNDHEFTVELFPNDPIHRAGVLIVHFPALSGALSRSMWFVVPSLIFTLVLLVTFIATLVLIFRQKKLTELKNDFINNMTHEFKTPISSISLAAQMLGDDTVKKTPQLMERLTRTIMDETKRLRMQVEKVLQLSMYEHQSANLRMQDIDINELVSGVIHTFTLKVEKNGGKIISQLEAENPLIYVDDMHLTNVVFNLMDNAIKYRRSDAELELKVKTWNEANKVCLSIQDNGIGIAKPDLKRVFEKFYRVHTGNLHDVKGFGLGLAYVKKIVEDHKGTINVDSEVGIGTTFTIKLPISEG